MLPFRWVFIVMTIMVSAGCLPSAPPAALGDVLLRADFSDPSAWEWYVSPTQGADFRVESGAYRARLTQEGIFSVYHEAMYTNSVTEVETTQNSDYRDNAYGVMCRASPSRDGDGYYFLISGDGYFTIRRGAGDAITPLIQWQASAAIRQGKEINRIRAACIGETLRLYVNGELVGETTDSLYLRGVTALTAGVTEGGAVDVTFDDLTVWAGALD